MNSLHKAWVTLFGLQSAANDVLAGPNWRTDPKVYDYASAMTDESVEARLSAGYTPFWSGGAAPEFDAKNLKLEIVDIAHFLMSQAMQGSVGQVSDETLAQFAAWGFESLPSRAIKFGEWDTSSLHLTLGYALIGNFVEAFGHFGALCHRAGLSFEELYGKYIAKNALNVFRKSIGYKQDKSVKYWVDAPYVKLVGVVVDEAEANEVLKEDGDYAEVGGDVGGFVRYRGKVIHTKDARIEDNVFVMAKVDEMVANGDNLLDITYDQMVEIIRQEYTRVTGKAA